MVFIMGYDMCYGSTHGESNDPLPRLRSDLGALASSFGVAPNKTVLGLPFYGYNYRCKTLKAHTCEAVAPANATNQIAYAAAMARIASTPGAVGPLLDKTSGSVFYEYADVSGVMNQLWIDGPNEIATRVEMAKELGLRGVGAWHGDCLNYTSGLTGATAAMWRALGAVI